MMVQLYKISHDNYTQACEQMVIQSHQGKGPHENKYQSLMPDDQVPTEEIAKLSALW